MISYYEDLIRGSLALLLLLGSSMAKAEQEGKDAEPKLLYKYSEVDT